MQIAVFTFSRKIVHKKPLRSNRWSKFKKKSKKFCFQRKYLKYYKIKLKKTRLNCCLKQKFF